jgi:hypothetical protein
MPELKMAQKLAQGYVERRLVKCVFEKVMQRKDRMIQRILSQKRFRDELAMSVAQKAGVRPANIYVDVPNTPSVPYTYERQTFKSIILLSSSKYGGKNKTETVPISELPLAGSITGFMDILRIYTFAEYRNKVAAAAQSVLGKDDFMSRISV